MVKASPTRNFVVVFGLFGIQTFFNDPIFHKLTKIQRIFISQTQTVLGCCSKTNQDTPLTHTASAVLINKGTSAQWILYLFVGIFKILLLTINIILCPMHTGKQVNQ